MTILRKIKYVLYSLGVLLIYMVASNLAVDFDQRPLELSLKSELSTNMEIKNYRLYDQSFVSWDDSNLKFFNLEGELLDQILGNGYFTDIYLTDNEVLVLDRQLNVLYFYNTQGQLEKKTDFKGNVFGLFPRGEDYYLHYKDEDNLNEYVVDLNNDEVIYESNKFIIDFLSKGSRQIISEITSENFAYRSTVIIKDGRNSNRYNFDNETILNIDKVGMKYMAVSNKNLYSLHAGEKNRVKIEDFRDCIFENDRVGILSGDSFTIYDNKLTVLETYDIDINPQGVFKYQGGYFIYGPTDLIGFLGQNREFREGFKQVIYGVTAHHDNLAIVYKQSAQIYDFIEKDKEKIDNRN